MQATNYWCNTRIIITTTKYTYIYMIALWAIDWVLNKLLSIDLEVSREQVLNKTTKTMYTKLCYEMGMALRCDLRCVLKVLGDLLRRLVGSELNDLSIQRFSLLCVDALGSLCWACVEWRCVGGTKDFNRYSGHCLLRILWAVRQLKYRDSTGSGRMPVRLHVKLVAKVLFCFRGRPLHMSRKAFFCNLNRMSVCLLGDRG